MAKSNKLEKTQEAQLKQLGEGLFSPIFKKLVQGRLKSQLKAFQKDPGMRDAIKRLDKSIEDFERELEISAELLSSTESGDLDRNQKERKKIMKKLGIKFFK